MSYSRDAQRESFRIALSRLQVRAKRGSLSTSSASSKDGPTTNPQIYLRHANELIVVEPDRDLWPHQALIRGLSKVNDNELIFTSDVKVLQTLADSKLVTFGILQRDFSRRPTSVIKEGDMPLRHMYPDLEWFDMKFWFFDYDFPVHSLEVDSETTLFHVAAFVFFHAREFVDVVNKERQDDAHCIDDILKGDWDPGVLITPQHLRLLEVRYTDDGTWQPDFTFEQE